jgi:hypothetical protein
MFLLTVSIITASLLVIVEVFYRTRNKMISANKVNTSSSPASDNDGVATSSLAYSSDKDAVCYLCLDGDLDNDGQPLQRDCACRGTDAGFVHLSCLANYAATKSKGCRLMNEFRKPWRVCPSCRQVYQNELGIDIASKFVSFVRRQYPSDTQMQAEALYLKLCALGSMFERLQPVQKIEAGVTANVMLSLIDRMRVVAPLPMRYSEMEADAYNVHGCIAIDEGTDESARRAVTHFENQLEVNKSIGNAEGIATAKSNIALAKSKYEGGNNEELVKASRELYELRIAELGEEHEDTIRTGRNYATDLRKANRGDEARELLTKLLTTSKQVFGPHHNTTKEVTSALKLVITFANQE